MKKYFAIILTVVIIFTVAIAGCEKKEAPKATPEPIATPVAPAPEPAAAPAPAAPAPAPAPAKPAKK